MQSFEDDISAAEKRRILEKEKGNAKGIFKTGEIKKKIEDMKGIIENYFVETKKYHDSLCKLMIQYEDMSKNKRNLREQKPDKQNINNVIESDGGREVFFLIELRNRTDLKQNYLKIINLLPKFVK